MVNQKLFVLIERPDGSTFEQEIEWREGESIKTALGRYARRIGKDYWICDWWLA